MPSPVALGHPPVVQELPASLDWRNGAFGGAEDVRGDFADTETVTVIRGKDLGGVLLLDVFEHELAEPPLEPRREDDEVGAVGVRDGFEVLVVGGDGRASWALAVVEVCRLSPLASGMLQKLAARKPNCRGITSNSFAMKFCCCLGKSNLSNVAEHAI